MRWLIEKIGLLSTLVDSAGAVIDSIGKVRRDIKAEDVERDSIEYTRTESIDANGDITSAANLTIKAFASDKSELEEKLALIQSSAGAAPPPAIDADEALFEPPALDDVIGLSPADAGAEDEPAALDGDDDLQKPWEPGSDDM